MGQPVILNGSIVSTHLPAARPGRHEIGFREINALPYHIVYLGGTLWALCTSTKGLSELFSQDCFLNDYVWELGVSVSPLQSGREI